MCHHGRGGVLCCPYHPLPSTTPAHPSNTLRTAVSSPWGPSRVTFPIYVGASICLGIRETGPSGPFPAPGPPFWARKGREVTRPTPPPDGCRDRSPQTSGGRDVRLSRKKGAREVGPALPWPARRPWMVQLVEIAELKGGVRRPQGAKLLESGGDGPGVEGQGYRSGPYLLPAGPGRGASGCSSAPSRLCGEGAQGPPRLGNACAQEARRARVSASRGPPAAGGP